MSSSRATQLARWARWAEEASPSVGALVKTLSHKDEYTRIYAAEALASIGPMAAAATHDLANALANPIPGVRWAACEALGSIGPAAHPAVPQLIDALADEFLYVRMFAAGALGSIGPKAQASPRGAESRRQQSRTPSRSGVGAESHRRGGVQLIGHSQYRRGSPTNALSHGQNLPTELQQAILRWTGIPPPGETSCGASSWGGKRMAVPWWLAIRSMWAPTTPGPGTPPS